MSVPVPLESLQTSGGGKADGLRRLHEAGFTIPRTWVLPADATAPIDLSQLVGDGKYAVRSSASVEDGSSRSFAGQFLTELDVPATSQALGEAIAAVRDSAGSILIDAYARKADGPIEMAVIIQEMVPPEAAGVAFSKNPVTGLSETIVEAVRGSGEQLVSGGVTPERWVWRWGDVVERPDEPTVPAEVVERVTELTAEVVEAAGHPVDLEWVWNGTEVVLVQMRPITGLRDITLYSNRISKEVMPGLIKPLVWSVNVPVVNQAWIELFSEALGPNDLTPGDLARQFGYRSYFNMGTIGDIFELLGMPRESLENLLGLPSGSDQPGFKPSRATYRKTPKLLALALRKSRYGTAADRLVPDLELAYRRYDRPLEADTDDQLLTAIDELMALATRAAYVNIVVPLLANLHMALLRRRLAKHDIDLSELDLTSDDQAFEEFDPNPHLDRLARRVEESGHEGGFDGAPESVVAGLTSFLDRFGHFSDSGNDFSVAPWREQPDMVLALARSRLGADGRRGGRPWEAAERSFGLASRPLLRGLRKRAVAYQLRRERVSSVYTYGYGLFRLYFLELGRRLVERGRLDSADDVMYVDLSQVTAAIRGSDDDLRPTVDHHRTAMRNAENLVMPELIYGDDFVPAPPHDSDGILRGVATSRGHHRGTIRVVTGIADFDRVEQGDVLAIPYADVGWTPLFAKAGAVIAESGGMLSHSSIVAREYGIPCVVSVPGATRMPDGAIAIVDAYRGEISLEPDDAQPSVNTRCRE